MITMVHSLVLSENIILIAQVKIGLAAIGGKCHQRAGASHFPANFDSPYYILCYQEFHDVMRTNRDLFKDCANVDFFSYLFSNIPNSETKGERKERFYLKV